MSNTISYIIKAVDKFSPIIKKMERSLGGLSSRIRSVSSRMNRFGHSMEGIGRTLSLRISGPIIALGAYAIKTASSFQQLKISFDAFMIAQKAGITGSQFFEKIFQFTKQTPFLFSNVAKASKMLLTTINYKDIVPTLKILGDAAATTGSSLSDLSRIYMQVNQMGKLQARYNRELQIRGIDIVGTIAKTYHITTAKVLKFMKAGKITAKVFDKAFASMDAKGGLFYRHMSMQMKSIAGVFTVLHDNVMVFASSIGMLIFKTLHLGGAIKKTSKFIGDMAEKIPKLAKAHPILTKIAIVLGTILAIAGPLAVAMGAIAISVSIISAPIIIISAVIASAVVGMTLLVRWLLKFKFVSDQVAKSWSFIKSYIKFIIESFKEVGKVFGSVEKFFSQKHGLVNYTTHKSEISNSAIGLGRLRKQSANVTVHIKDKGKNVSKVETRRNNMPNFHIGLNMFGTSPSSGGMLIGGA